MTSLFSVNNKGPKGQHYRVSSPTHGMLLWVANLAKKLSHPQQVQRENIMTTCNNLFNHQQVCKERCIVRFSPQRRVQVTPDFLQKKTRNWVFGITVQRSLICERLVLPCGEIKRKKFQRGQTLSLMIYLACVSSNMSSYEKKNIALELDRSYLKI